MVRKNVLSRMLMNRQMISRDATICESRGTFSVEKEPVYDATQCSRDREAREIRPYGLDDEPQHIAKRALHPGNDRAKEHGCGGEGQVAQRDFQAFADLNGAQGGEHHLNGEENAGSSERLRPPQGKKGRFELIGDMGKYGMHQKTPPQIKSGRWTGE